MSMGTIAVIGLAVGAAVSIGTTIYTTNEAKKAAEEAQRKAELEKKKQKKEMELQDKYTKEQLAISEEDAKFETADVADGVSMTDLFMGGGSSSDTKPKSTGISGTSPVENTLGV